MYLKGRSHHPSTRKIVNVMLWELFTPDIELPSEYRPYQYADRKPNRHSPRHCLAVGKEDGMGTRR